MAKKTQTEMLNAIRSLASAGYQSAVPMAIGTRNANNLVNVYQAMLDYEPAMNEFLNIINQISGQTITVKLWENPLAVFKTDAEETGDTWEEIFIDLCKAHDYDPSYAAEHFSDLELPNVRAAFHRLNFQKFVKQTVSEEQFRQAVTTWGGLASLIDGIISQMYESVKYYEYLGMMYLVARNVLDGTMKEFPIGDMAADSENATVNLIALSDALTLKSRNYNFAGVLSVTGKEDQFLLTNPVFSANMNVKQLATAFNMDKTEFMGHRVLVNSFGDIDLNDLNDLFGDDPGFKKLDIADLDRLKKVQAVLVDRRWFKVFNVLNRMKAWENGEGLSWNRWLHFWRTLSASPFENAVILTTEASTVSAVNVMGVDSMTQGTEQTLTASVSGEGFFNTGVTWEADGEYVTIASSTPTTALVNAKSPGDGWVKATSVFDKAKTKQFDITVS